MPVTTEREEYKDLITPVKTVRDCVAGEHVVKAGGTLYLPLRFSSETEWYEDYKQRAKYINFVGRTLHGFLGMINRKEHVIEVPPQLEYMIGDCDGAGKPINEMITDILSELMIAGSAPYLCDYSKVDPSISAYEEAIIGASARFTRYYFEDRHNWHDQIINGHRKNVLTVLKEAIWEPGEDIYERKAAIQYKTLALIDGSYMYETRNKEGEVVEEFALPLAQGKPLNEIPLVTFGAESNDSTLDRPMLEDIAYLNLGHYINSADFEESCHMSGQGYMVIDTGLVDSEKFREINPNGVRFGSRGGLCGQGFSAQLLQLSPNSQPMEGMTKKEEQMRAIAAKMISPTTVQQTAEARRIDSASEVSRIETLLSNAEKGLERLLGYACDFMGGDKDKISIKLNRELFPETLTPQEITASMLMFDRGIIDKIDVRDRIKRIGIVDPERDDSDVADGTMLGIGNDLES